NSVMKEAPDRSDAYFNLGLILLEKGNREEAMTLLERAGTLQPDNAKVFYIPATQNACAAARRSLEPNANAVPKQQTSSARADFYLQLGKLLFRAGKTVGSLAADKTALSLSPSDGAAHSAIARVYLRLKEDDRAVSEFQEAIRLSPELPEPYYHLAQYYARKGRRDEAQRFSETFVRKTALTRKTPGQYA